MAYRINTKNPIDQQMNATQFVNHSICDKINSERSNLRTFNKGQDVKKYVFYQQGLIFDEQETFKFNT